MNGVVEYASLLSVAMYSDRASLCSGFEQEFKVAKRLFKLFPSFSREHFLTIEEARQMTHAYSHMQRTPIFNMLTGFCMWSWQMKGCPCCFQSTVI